MRVTMICFHVVFKLFIAPICLIKGVPLTNGTCPAGYYIKGQFCVRCESGSYISGRNAMTNCSPCKWCDVPNNEVMHKDCSATENRECVCKSGFHRDGDFCKPCHDCQNCSRCLSCEDKCNKHTTLNTTPLVCGDGYFQDGGQCKSCLEFKCKSEPCKSFCTTLQPKGQSPLLLVSLIIMAFLGSIFVPLIYSYRHRWLCWQNKVRHDAAHLYLQNQPVMQVSKEESWPAAVLYIIIRVIPVSRWKEFLRLLSVSDDQIERIELEGGLSYLEKQYSMLRLWSQGRGSKLEKIYSTLHYMNLSGCAEELQEKLEQANTKAS